MYEKSKSVASAIKYFEIRDTYGYSFARFALKNELLMLSMVLFKNTVSTREIRALHFARMFLLKKCIYVRYKDSNFARIVLFKNRFST